MITAEMNEQLLVCPRSVPATVGPPFCAYYLDLLERMSALLVWGSSVHSLAKEGQDTLTDCPKKLYAMER